MVCQRWLLVSVLACVCAPGLGLPCWNSSVCNNLSNERRIQNCIRHCIPKIQAELQQLSEQALATNDNSDPLQGVILAILTSAEIPELGLKPHGNERRAYNMEHFRWGKPGGRKRRPVKVFASSQEGVGGGGGGGGGGSSFEGGFPAQVRRQAGGAAAAAEEEAKAGPQSPGRSKVKSQMLSAQDRKGGGGGGGGYRMSHFRWGNPPVSKRNGSFTKGEKSKEQLANIFRNILYKDVQRIMAEMEVGG